MTPEEMADLVHLRRARDPIDRDYAQPLVGARMVTAGGRSQALGKRRYPSGNLVRIAQA